MKHERMSEHLYMKRKHFHTTCVFTSPDAHVHTVRTSLSHTCIQCVRHSAIHVYSACVTQSYMYTVRMSLSHTCIKCVCHSVIHVYSAYVTQSYMCKQKLADMAVECDCHQHYTPSRTLRSASDTLSLQITRIRRSTVGSRAFSVFGPSAWNDLPLPLQQKP